MRGSRTGQNNCHYTRESSNYWDEYHFKSTIVCLIAKTVQTIYDLVKTRNPHKRSEYRRIAQKNPGYKDL